MTTSSTCFSFARCPCRYLYIYIYKKSDLAEDWTTSRVFINDAFPQIPIKSDQNTTAPLKHQLCNAFRTAIQNHATSMADVQNPDDRHYLQTVFSIVFNFTAPEQNRSPSPRSNIKGLWKCVWTRDMFSWTNQALVIPHIPAVKSNKQGCAWSAAGYEFRE